MRTRKTNRTRLAVWLCAGLMLFCLLMLVKHLGLFGQAFRSAEPDGSFFGMVLIDIGDQETAASYHVEECGVYVLAVQDESPAQAAGVLSGDRLISLNGTPLRETANVAALQNSFVQGRAVRMDFERGTANDSYGVTLVWNEEERPEK